MVEHKETCHRLLDGAAYKCNCGAVPPVIEEPMDRKRALHDIAPDGWDAAPLSFAHELARLLETVKDHGTAIDSGTVADAANLWVTVGGVEYFLTICKSAKQRGKEGGRYRCPTCSGGGEIAPTAECPDCDGTGSCVPPAV